MRSGGVTAARDLQAMDHEVGQLAERQRMLEDEELVLMEEEEPLDVALAAQESEAAALALEEARLSTAVAEGGGRAAGHAGNGGGGPDRTRPRDCRPSWPSATSGCAAHLGGVGAARLVGDRCDGCHLTLPSVEVERIRSLPEDTFATCPQCDRILVH